MKSVVWKEISMVESINFSKPIYNGVNITIRKPEVITKAATDGVTNPLNDNGIYNAVNIDVDNPKVSSQPQTIYDYPEADGIVTYEMLNFNPIPLNIGNEQELLPEKIQIEDKPEKVEEKQVNIEETEIPAPNYTTVEAEKEDNTNIKNSELTSALSFRANETNVKKPEIIPSEPILPKVDIALISDNLTSTNKDVQAQQIEEIVRTAILDPENAKNYLVSDIFTGLINITKEDATKLAGPTQKQIEARQKLIANIIAVEKDQKAINNLPYKMSDEEIAFATNLSPMELVERNKEYAITALGALAEIFIEDFEEKEDRIVPITDAPGVSAIVNALRKDPDSGIKLAAIDALRHIQRDEYKEELSALFTLAQTDPNPNVSRAATKSLEEINKN